ncbi:MAG: CHC2 zinc finger domain-containing protein [Thermodesulforhabdaceae bacterium]|jgi:DNA primase
MVNERGSDFKGHSLHEIVQALVGRRAGDGYMYRCPDHDYHEPSLHVTQNSCKILFHCFAECSQNTVLNALKERGL